MLLARVPEPGRCDTLRASSGAPVSLRLPHQLCIVHGGAGRPTCSHSGVLNTLSLPNRSKRPFVARNTPPKATSSPKTQDLQYQQVPLRIWQCPCKGIVCVAYQSTSRQHLEVELGGACTYRSLVSMAMCSASLTALHRLSLFVSAVPRHRTRLPTAAPAPLRATCEAASAATRWNAGNINGM